MDLLIINVIVVIFVVVVIWLILITDFYLYHKSYPNMKATFGFNGMNSISGGRKQRKSKQSINEESKRSSKNYNKNKHFTNTRKQSTTQSNDNIWIPQQSFPQVGVLTNEILYKTPLSDFVVLEKTDGLHAIVIIKNKHIYVIKFGQAEVQPVELNEVFDRQTILDCEWYNNKYYIFDCPQINGEMIDSKPFTERMNRCHEWLTSHKSSLSNLFVIKQFENINTDKLCSLIKLINETNISPKTGNRIDGIIFQNINLPYFYDKGRIVFKLKKPVLNTVDFKLIYEESENIFYLYLIGTYKHVLYNKKKLPKTNTKSLSHVGVDLRNKPYPKSLYVLFSSPYFENLYLFEPDINYNRQLYFKEEQQVIDKLINDISANPKAYNGKIVEMSLAINNELDAYWVPMRVREDKQNSNSYDVGLSNVSVMFNPITTSSILDSSNYFTKSKKLHFDESITGPYHDIAKLLRLYMIERNINQNQKLKQIRHLSCLDLAGGRGADELALYNCGVDNIFAMDADKAALVQYVERTSYTPRINDFKFLLKESVIRKSSDSILINAIYGFLGPDDSNIESDIKAREECPTAGFDIVLMNYAIHYLCDNPESISELARFVKSVIKPGGFFIFSCFDGDEILDIIHNSGGHVGPFTITMSDEKHNIAHMPLPTIDSSGYRDEPLVLKSCLKPFDEFKLIDSFHPLESVSKLEQYKDITDSQNVSDFLKHIICYVYESN